MALCNQSWRLTDYYLDYNSLGAEVSYVYFTPRVRRRISPFATGQMIARHWLEDIVAASSF
jgi:hypothetical protein